MKALTHLISTVALIIFSSCSRNPFVITDYYVVYSEGEFGSGYYLMCKLGCNYDAKIEYVKSIEWNKKYLIVQQEKPNQSSQWYIIRAKEEELRCCGRDTLIGTLTEQEIENYKKQHSIGELRNKNFK